MASPIQQLRGTAAELDGYTGKNAVVTYDETRKSLRVHDGVTSGGRDIGVPTGGEIGQVLGYSGDPGKPTQWIDILKASAVYQSRFGAEFTFINPNIDALVTLGYNNPGDGGGAEYKKVPSEPSHPGKFQSADGAWWELAESIVNPMMFGAKGDGLADDTTAIQNALAIARPLHWLNRTYRITSKIALTATKPVIWNALGARIVVDAPSSIQRAVEVELAGNLMVTSGRLAIDGQSKSFTGLYVSNLSATKANVQLAGLTIKNCYRASTTFTGGDGIFVIGNFGMVVVQEFDVSEIKMAAGAGVSGSQGVAGITVTRDNTNLRDADLVIIENGLVARVYSEDAAYTADQDGIKVFSGYDFSLVTPREVGVCIRNIRLSNCLGRALKMQTDTCLIDGITINRDGAIRSSYVGNPDIDLQVGGGTIQNVNCFYAGNFPSRVINVALSSAAGELDPMLIKIDGIQIVERGGGDGFERFAVIYANEDTSANTFMIDISGVYLTTAKTKAYFTTVQGSSTSTKIMVSARSIFWRVDPPAVIYRIGSASPLYVTGSNICLAGSGSKPLASGSSTAAITSALIGANFSVT